MHVVYSERPILIAYMHVYCVAVIAAYVRDRVKLNLKLEVSAYTRAGVAKRGQ